jgi:putative ABC transport system permease protein
MASGLLVRSLFNLQKTNPGLTPDQLFAAEVDLTAGRYQTAEQATKFYRELTARVQTLPGVAAVTFGTLQPLSGTGNSDPFAIEGRKLDPANLTSAGWQLIGPNYLHALGIPLIRGRDLEQADMAVGAPPVAIINEKMATRYWPNEDPVGRRITLGLPRPDNPWVTIVGIARSVPHRALDSQPEPDWYLSQTVRAQRHGYLFVRTVLPISSLTNSIRNEIAAMDRSQPLTGVKSMTVVIGETTAPRQFNTLVVGLFAALALLLATLGIYSVISYSVALSTQEIGIRVALGARNRTILGLVIRRGMMPALIGAGSGVIAAVGLTRLLSGFLFGVSAFDPLTYFIVILFLVGAAFLACVIPARRASRVDPLVALRYE